MKKTLLIAIIAILGIATAQAQDSIRTNFDFRTYVLTDTVNRSNGSKVLNEVCLLPVYFVEDKVAFNFRIKSYNATNPDSIFQIGREKSEQVELNNNEMNAIVFNRRVWEWFEMYYKDGFPSGITPEMLTKEIGELVYYYKVSGTD